MFRRHSHHIEAHRLRAAFAHANHGLRSIVQREGVGRLEGEAQFRVKEAPAAHESFARVFAVDDVVDRREIVLAIALAAFRRGILPCGRLRPLHPLGCRRMRRQEVLHPWIERGLAGLQLGIAFHRGQETRGAVGVEMGTRRNADADVVGLELLGAGKARHRQFGFGERKGGEVRIVAHVGYHARDDGGLSRLVLPDRGVLCQHMRHLVGEH